MQYQLIITSNGIKKIEAGITYFIPNDPANIDWQDYQNWLSAGNTPDPADE